MKRICVILDPAHGLDTLGKRSPDGSHREAIWSRERVSALQYKLAHMGYSVFLTTDSEKEPGLSYRKRVATEIKSPYPKVLFSIHNNAAGDGSSWMSARGASVYTTEGKTKSDVCAEIILDQFEQDFPDIKIRKYSHEELGEDFEKNFTVLMGSGYYGVLIEWLFQDNKEDVELLKNEEINEQFEESLINAIERINEHFA